MSVRKIFVLIVLASVVLVGCGRKPTDVKLGVSCVRGNCKLFVQNLSRQNLRIEVDLESESAGVPMRDMQRYPGTAAQTHDYWAIQYSTLFRREDVLAKGETARYEVDSVTGTGQTLVRMHVYIDNGWSNPVHVYKYTVIDFGRTDQPIANTLRCDNHRIVARTELAEGIGEVNMGVYVDDLEKPIANYIVKDGAYTEVNMPMPEAGFILLDVNGHRSPYATMPLVTESHGYRVYCIPSESGVQ